MGSERWADEPSSGEREQQPGAAAADEESGVLVVVACEREGAGAIEAGDEPTGLAPQAIGAGAEGGEDGKAERGDFFGEALLAEVVGLRGE